MPRKRQNVKTRRPEAIPFTVTDSRILQHICGHDYFGDGYGRGADFDRERMKRDWRERRDEIVTLARILKPDRKTLWSEEEFDDADFEPEALEETQTFTANE
jgi:hypothetical protein